MSCGDLPKFNGPICEECEKIEKELSEARAVCKVLEEFYFYMRIHHGHQNVEEALNCDICEVMEQVKHSAFLGKLGEEK